jgi:hypothetical protein
MMTFLSSANQSRLMGARAAEIYRGCMPYSVTLRHFPHLMDDERAAVVRRYRDTLEAALGGADGVAHHLRVLATVSESTDPVTADELKAARDTLRARKAAGEQAIGDLRPFVRGAHFELRLA